MPNFETRMTMESAARDRKRQARAAERAEKERQKQRKLATAGTPLLQGEESLEVNRG